MINDETFLEASYMVVIAIANEKGGVAKTTTAISLGGALVESGYEVLLIDLDPQANLTLGLGVTPGKLRRSIADVLMSSASITSVSRGTDIPGLDLVPSNPGMGIAERFLPVRQDYAYILKNALGLVSLYDYILLDCPPSLGAVTLNALTAADRVIAPTQPEYFSAYGLRSVLGLIRRVRGLSVSFEDLQHASDDSISADLDHSRDEPDRLNSKGTNPAIVYHILITMFDRRNRIHQTLLDQLRTTFGGGLFKTVIEVDTKLRESTVAGQPITTYFPRTRSSMQYRELAQEIIQYAKEKAPKQD
jgi:chromosome partitioning protein